MNAVGWNQRPETLRLNLSDDLTGSHLTLLPAKPHRGKAVRLLRSSKGIALGILGRVSEEKLHNELTA